MPMDTTESSTLYHIPQQSISHTKPAGIEYRQTHGIENMETDVIDYQTQKPLHVPQPITHKQKPGQTESSTIYHIPQQSISHSQPPPLQYMQQKTIHHIPTQESIQQPVISYNPQQTISHRPQQAILHTPQQTISHTPQQEQQPLQQLSNSQHMLEPTIQHPIISNPSQNIDRKPHDESIYYVCTLCETDTKFKEYSKLEKHVRRFHSDFNQSERGSKRKRIKDDEVFPKKAKWNWT